jgi:hypothetical protein
MEHNVGNFTKQIEVFESNMFNIQDNFNEFTQMVKILQ